MEGKVVTCFKCGNDEIVEHYSIKWRCPICYPKQDEMLLNRPKFISVNDEKPEDNSLVYVTNERYCSLCFRATYHKKDDYFLEFDATKFNHIPIDVTHWHYLGDAFSNMCKSSYM